MKVLHVSFDHFSGGAAIAALRLHRAMLTAGIDSKFLVARKQGKDPSIIGPNKVRSIINLILPSIARMLIRTQQSGNYILHSINIFPSRIHLDINRSGADIVNLHWINGETMSIAEVAKIRIPIVWTFHDSWPICGAEHHPIAGGNRHIEGYNRKNRPHGHSGIDIDRWVWKRKLRYWRSLKFNIVCPSKWLAEIVKTSKLFSKSNIVNIPNGLDLATIAQFDQTVARNHLKLPLDKKLILVGTIGYTDNPDKGQAEFISAINLLASAAKISNVEVIVVGAYASKLVNKIAVPIHYLGEFRDDLAMALVYSASDVLVVTSKRENLPNVIVEAFSCACPVVAFNVGGIQELIDHKNNGYLVESGDILGLVKGMQWVLEDTARHFLLQQRAREKIKELCDINKIVAQYIRFYKNCLENRYV